MFAAGISQNCPGGIPVPEDKFSRIVHLCVGRHALECEIQVLDYRSLLCDSGPGANIGEIVATCMQRVVLGNAIRLQQTLNFSLEFNFFLVIFDRKSGRMSIVSEPLRKDNHYAGFANVARY